MVNYRYNPKRRVIYKFFHGIVKSTCAVRENSAGKHRRGENSKVLIHAEISAGF